VRRNEKAGRGNYHDYNILKEMVKITDVAKEANVSASTVSHVLSGNRPISKKTRERVLEVINRLGYEPNKNAQALKSKHSGIIGFFASDITELFVNHIIRGVEKVTGEYDHHLLFASGREFGHDLRKTLLFLQRRNIDGLIVSYEITEQNEDLDLTDITIPIVTINRNVSDSIISVLPNNFKGGYDAANTFMNKGVKFPAVIAGPENRRSSRERLEGFLTGLQEHGIDREKIPLLYGNYDFESGYHCAEKLFNQESRIDGLFCHNDYMAAGAISCAVEKKIEIPGKLKIIGYDNRDFSAFWPTPISTFSQPLEEMGEKSARLLMDLIREKKIEQTTYIMDSEFIERKSSES
jgi:LacI family transcriptional regulator